MKNTMAMIMESPELRMLVSLHPKYKALLGWFVVPLKVYWPSGDYFIWEEGEP